MELDVEEKVAILVFCDFDRSRNFDHCSSKVLRELAHSITLIVILVILVQLPSILLLFNISDLVFLDPCQIVPHYLKLFVQTFLILCLLLHVLHFNLHCLLFLQDTIIDFLFVIKLTLHMLDLLPYFGNLLLTFVYLLFRVVCLFTLLSRSLSSIFSLLLQTLIAVIDCKLCSLEQSLDIVNIFSHHELPVAEFADFAALSLPILILLTPWVDSSFLQALSIVREATEIAKVHLIRLREYIVARRALFDLSLSG